MNVLVTNKQQDFLAGLDDIEIVKTIRGEFDVEEFVGLFKNFFFGRMILDITAIKDFQNVLTLQKLAMQLDADKIILVLPENDPLVTSTSFLSKIISMGYYNFATKLEEIRYLLERPNIYKDVAHIQQLNELSSTVVEKVVHGAKIIGIKNVTDHAGATTLIYMLKKELTTSTQLKVVAIEIGRRDFAYFNDPRMISISKDQLPAELLRNKEMDVILVDLNEYPDDGTCNDVLYLIEPSSLKLSKMLRRDKDTFQKLKGKKIVLNKSLLTSNEVTDFEFESQSKVFYNMPPINERKRHNAIIGLLSKIGLVRMEKEEKEEKNKIFGLFKF